jgi:hypothetical protein
MEVIVARIASFVKRSPEAGQVACFDYEYEFEYDEYDDARRGAEMPSPRVSALTREEITATAKRFRWNRQMPKWSVIVEGRELPARPLVLEAAGVPPNDPTNSHQAIAILKDRGFAVRYEGKTLQDEGKNEGLQPVTDEFIRSLVGCCKGEDSLVDAREREHRMEK